ncbi:uncharacterized protein K452DRAFT_313234 [Aplosporella prunicola CBS 121167]|uniref:Extracellular membrane protein CFEM domain-containing protein n=1 Tax=Aplosporella prunicola CBS 121167 TaxID=1176127 RepID=A0A6A6AYN0_9PEZI|nr:uncharacterized protein K452DRAFT_313234 [Aplosporella prunicola CBS 121167]KAF2136368.1 hypothetical protein K452DRAFT_313234 [Aplosporella prunicola CBS 121167]
MRISHLALVALAAIGQAVPSPQENQDDVYFSKLDKDLSKVVPCIKECMTSFYSEVDMRAVTRDQFCFRDRLKVRKWIRDQLNECGLEKCGSEESMPRATLKPDLTFHPRSSTWLCLRVKCGGGAGSYQDDRNTEDSAKVPAKVRLRGTTKKTKDYLFAAQEDTWLGKAGRSIHGFPLIASIIGATVTLAAKALALKWH